MALAQLFFRKGNFIENIEFDAVITEGAESSATITSFPVEKGADMSDHIIIAPMKFFVQGVVSNISSNVVGQFISAFNRFTSDESRALDTWNKLLELQANRTIFTLVQGLRDYNNVVLQNLREEQDVNTSNGLFFRAELQEIIIAGALVGLEEQFNEGTIMDMGIQGVSGGFKQLGSIA